ncbi:MAG: hypothetical protein JWO09_795 [Bacteroidetes bacterium]|nr:hypothetical protein [Bacteroidota bacterium]
MPDQLVKWMEENMQPCGFKQLTGANCPGCGTQRAFILLLKGEVWESICMYPALIPIIILFIFLIVHLLVKFKKGGIYLMYNFILVMTLILGNFFFKLFI